MKARPWIFSAVFWLALIAFHGALLRGDAKKGIVAYVDGDVKKQASASETV